MATDQQTIASELVTEVAKELASGSPTNLVALVRKLYYASDLLGWEGAANWFRTELDGCQDANAPQHRFTNATVEYLSPLAEMYTAMSSGTHPPTRSATTRVKPLCHPLADLVRYRTTGYTWLTGNTRPSEEYSRAIEKERITFLPGSVTFVLDRIEELCFKFAIEAQRVLVYGNRIGDIFGEYQAFTEGELRKLGIDDSLAAIDTNLQSGTAENAKLAILGCRNILLALSNKLWLVPNLTTHPTLKTYDGKSPLPLGPENPKARLRAYLHERGVALVAKRRPTLIAGQLERIADTLDELYNLSSEQGKNEAVLADAKSAALQTFFLMGEIARLTGFEPVTSLSGQPAS
jgi:hypothetical protein